MPPPFTNLPFVEVTLFEPQVTWVKLWHHLGAYIDAVHLAQPFQSVTGTPLVGGCGFVASLVLGTLPPRLATDLALRILQGNGQSPVGRPGPAVQDVSHGPDFGEHKPILKNDAEHEMRNLQSLILDPYPHLSQRTRRALKADNVTHLIDRYQVRVGEK